MPQAIQAAPTRDASEPISYLVGKHALHYRLGKIEHDGIDKTMLIFRGEDGSFANSICVPTIKIDECVLYLTGIGWTVQHDSSLDVQESRSVEPAPAE